MKLFLSICSLFLAMPAGFAQDRKMTLAECLQIGEGGNLQLMAANHRTEADGESVRLAKSGNIPSLNAAIDYGSSHSSPDKGDQWYEHGAISSRLSVPIFEGMRTKYEVSAAKNGLTATELEGTMNRLKIRRLISSAFYQVEIGQREMELGQRIAQRRKEQKQLLELRYKAGDEPRWAVTQADSEIADSLVDIEEIRANLESDRDDLRQLLNLSSNTVIIAMGSASFKEFSPPEDLSSIVQQLPEIQVAGARLEQTKAQVQIEKSDRWPKISAFGSWQRNLVPTKDGSIAFGIEANIKLFDPGIAARIRKSQESIAAAELDLADLRTRTTASLRRAIRAYQISLKKLESSRRGMNAALERAKIIGEEYTAGFRQYLEWEQTERQLVQFEKGSYAAEKSAAISKLELEFISAGKIL